MASSRKSQTKFSSAIQRGVADVLSRAGVRADQTLQLALSGGMDSMALLSVLAGLRERFGFALRAHHVHHGLSPNADEWAAFCAARCASLEVPLSVSRVSVQPAAGEGWEAAARRERQGALASEAADWRVSAHHLDDQAETVMFRLLRGAGVHGAAAMRAIDMLPSGGGRLRPLLAFSRGQILAFAQAESLAWVEDESNTDPRFSRNFLRHSVMPAMGERWPSAATTLARAAANFDEAAGLLDELAVQDAEACGRPWSRDVMRGMSAARLANLLRWRMRALSLPVPDQARLHEAIRQVQSCANDRPLTLPLGGAVLHAYREVVWVSPTYPDLPEDGVLWPGEAVAWGEGVVEAVAVVGAGVSQARLAQATRCEIMARWPGCRVALVGRPRKDVRSLSQGAGLAPVDRDRVPILRVDGQVAWIAGLGVAGTFACRAGEAGWRFVWRRPEAYSADGVALL
ncbi:MAG: tRNA lysidine(34) synthetase TilS [Denitromonas halophila]|nr:MAG: tRNA lysidine(34) synthetase TilS [Denitromonas halophila]